MPELPAAPLVLDTHVWIWTVGGSRESMGTSAVRQIDEASRGGRVLVAAISVWEVAMLERKGRIALAMPLEGWIAAALRAPGVRLLELTPEIAMASTRLPASPPADLADRMLIASARSVGGTLVTRDLAILHYASAGHLSVLDARD